MDGHRGNRQNGRFCCRARARTPQKAKVVRTLLPLSPFHRREEKRSEMEWYCCKWPLPPLFCCNNDNFIAFQPRTRTLPSLPTKVRPSELSLFISLSTELWMLFPGAKIPFRFSLPCSMRPFDMFHYSVKTQGTISTVLPQLFLCVIRLPLAYDIHSLTQNIITPFHILFLRPDVVPESSSQNLLEEGRKLLRGVSALLTRSLASSGEGRKQARRRERVSVRGRKSKSLLILGIHDGRDGGGEKSPPLFFSFAPHDA